MRRLPGLILIIQLLITTGCSQKLIHVSYPEKFEGLTQLVLASETKNVSFVEDVTKRILGIFPSSASVQVNSNVTFDFYLDFETDGYEISFTEDQKTMNFLAPPIRVKKPVINSSTVSYPDKGMLVNEEKEAVKILENLTERFQLEGQSALQEAHVIDKCKEKLEEYLRGLCSQFGYAQVEIIEISFYRAGL
ncbi:MAG: hypothetical protein JW996_03030 [Candidatus Cloacimonetes bacterium]|nr:hypothetical protein [Candidatus Cloacimonadota bacterium]